MINIQHISRADDNLDKIMKEYVQYLEAKNKYLNQYKTIPIELWLKYNKYYKFYSMQTPWYIPCDAFSRLSIAPSSIKNPFCIVIE